MGRVNLGSINLAQKAQTKELSTQMRSAHFKMGSILPEHNSYKPSQLDRSNSGSIGLANKGSFKPIASRSPVQSQQVSAGNNIAKGSGSFQTVNQQFTNWIQPSAVMS